VWATATDEGLLWQIDATRNAPIRSFRVGSSPAAVALGAGFVWVANGEGTLVRLNPSTRKTDTIKLGGSPRGIAFARGLLWVAID
jgi:DNA-binding beta-propeller fold protein YncE